MRLKGKSKCDISVARKSKTGLLHDTAAINTAGK